MFKGKMKKIYKFLFDLIICKTPESWQSIRNFFVKKFIKKAGKKHTLAVNAVYIRIL